ncbi:MAG: DNA mismatch repair endonuclease MutL, partial [Erysipelotrichaceae bacterium]|nr:DNA mismatch repair endonuclease MutL [Erysipelotrichaceae bacterium]
MGYIKVMDPHLSNMIAAGEVVDRPVNIVKECVENALDAGAQTIEIEVFQGGIEGITITDDGCGMDADDAVLAFSRHATSKLKDEQDLFNIQTMGFRGEALASIAAVAKVDLQTNNSEKGTHVRFEYGENTVTEEFSCPRGTRIEITGLFLHTPARFKYLKRANYEFSIIADTVNKMALSHPKIRFILRHDGRLIFQSSGKGNQLEILYSMYGREVAENAQPFRNESDDFVISGYAVQPKITRANKNFIYLTINSRLIKSYALTRAVIEGYSELMPKERYPIVLLNVEIDPQLVDVNVHPNKLEVRISKEEYLQQLIINTIENLFSDQLVTPEMDLAKARAEAVPVQESLKMEYILPRVQEKKESKHEDQPSELEGHPLIRSYEQGNAEKTNLYVREHDVAKKPLKDELREEFKGAIPGTAFVPDYPPEQKKEQPVKEQPVKKNYQKGMEFFAHLRIIGQLKDSYILCENPDGLVVIDQHAAQERYNFERLENLFDKPVIALQPCMVPLRIPVSADLFVQLDEINEYTSHYGLKFEAFGKNQFILRELPAWFMDLDQKSFLDDLMAWFQKNKK